MMDIKEYQKFAPTTLAVAGDTEATVENCVMGLVGEVGEIFDLLKKHWFHKKGEPLNVEKLIDEVGDVLWYTANLATVIDFKLIGYTCKRDYPANMSNKKHVLLSLYDLFGQIEAISGYFYDDLSNEGIDPPHFSWKVRHHLGDIVESLQNFLDAIQQYLCETEPLNTHAPTTFTISFAMEWNVAKLQKRHQGGFNPYYKSYSVQ